MARTDLKAIRDLLKTTGQSLADAGIGRAPALLPGALLATIKAVEFVTEQLESLERRVAALESKER